MDYVTVLLHLKLELRHIQRYTPVTCYTSAPLYNIIILIFDTKLLNTKDNEFNSVGISPRQPSVTLTI